MTSNLPSYLQTFIQHVDTLSKKDPETGRHEYEKEYRKQTESGEQVSLEINVGQHYVNIMSQGGGQELQLITMRHHEENTLPAECGKTQLNFPKNRYKDIIAYDQTRVHLSENSEGSDYVNANYIKDVSGDYSYIAAQGPLPHTVNDFWRMLWEQNTEIVVMLCKEKELNKAKCHRYWANEGEVLQFGDIEVTLESQVELSSDYFKRHILAKYNGETRTITQHHFLGWPDRGVPEDPTIIFDIVINMRMDQENNNIPPVIHCSAGCGRTGTIIAVDYAWSVLKTGKLTQDFSMYGIIENMREQRPSIVQTPDQYLLVHLAVQALFKEHLELIEDHIYANYDPSEENETEDTIEVGRSANKHEKEIIESPTPALRSTLQHRPERQTIVMKTVEQLVSQIENQTAEHSETNKPIPVQRKINRQTESVPNTIHKTAGESDIGKVTSEIKQKYSDKGKNINVKSELPNLSYENVEIREKGVPCLERKISYENTDTSSTQKAEPLTKDRKASYVNAAATKAYSPSPTGRKGSYTNIDSTTGKPVLQTNENKFVTKISIAASKDDKEPGIIISKGSIKKKDINANVLSDATANEPPLKSIPPQSSQDVYATIQPKESSNERSKSDSEPTSHLKSAAKSGQARSSHTVPRVTSMESPQYEKITTMPSLPSRNYQDPLAVPRVTSKESQEYEEITTPPLPSRNYQDPLAEEKTADQPLGTLSRLKNKILKTGRATSDSTETAEQSLMSNSDVTVFRDAEMGYGKRVGKPKGPRNPPTAWKTVIQPGGFVTYL